MGIEFSTDDTPRTTAVKLALVAVVLGAGLLYDYVGGEGFAFIAYVAFCLAMLGAWLYWLYWMRHHAIPRSEGQRSN